MATIISIETSTTVCSACLSVDGEIVANKEDYKGQNHSVVLGGYVKELLDYAHSKGLKLDAVAVSCGPGSYTGLRIGVSTAKGICYGADAKLIAVNTLKAMASGVIRTHCEIADGAWLCPMIDARRMEVYNAFYNLNCRRLVRRHHKRAPGSLLRQRFREVQKHPHRQPHQLYRRHCATGQRHGATGRKTVQGRRI